MGQTIQVTRKKMKTIRLFVTSPDAQIKISAPYWVSDTEIKTFYAKSRGWVEQQQIKIRNKPVKIERLCAGVKIPVWGEEFKLELKNNPRKSYLDGDSLIIGGVKSFTDEAEIAERINEFYRNLVSAYVEDNAKEQAEEMGVTIVKYTFRKMKTRWGSCNPSLKKINLNTELAKFPQNCLQYVLIHEMAHCYELSHNARFWKIVERFYPLWREVHKQLHASSYK